MAKESKTPLIVETIPSVQNGLSAIASGNAPVVFFDNVTNFGTYNGIAHITLTVMRFLPGDDGIVRHDNAVAAHLRMNIPALMVLKESISNIETILKPPENVSVN
jgi:hypothetical protein